MMNTVLTDKPEKPSIDRESLIDLCCDLSSLDRLDQRSERCAAEVCQCCGNVSAWYGWVHGMLTHLGKRREFVCPQCRGNEIPESIRETSDRLDAKPVRYCEICAIPHPMVRLRAVGRRWLCMACESVLQQRTKPEGFAQFLQNFVRVRYIGRGFTSEESLRRFYRRLRGVGENAGDIRRSKHLLDRA